MPDDVIAEAPSAPTSTSQDAPPAGVNDRPVDNLAGEMNRKFQQLNSKFDQFMAQMQPQQRPSAPQPTAGEPSVDDELWSRAQQGDKEAFRKWTQTEADKRYAQHQQAASRAQMILGQISALQQQYPVFQDSQHPLTQTAQQAYQLMVQGGYPANQATMLDAMKTAIAGRPEIVAELHGQGAKVAEHSRQSASRAATGQTRASYQRDAAPSTSTNLKVSAEELQLAKRMNIKDPKGAKQRFLERQADGRSQVGAVSAFLPPDSLETF